MVNQNLSQRPHTCFPGSTMLKQSNGTRTSISVWRRLIFDCHWDFLLDSASLHTRRTRVGPSAQTSNPTFRNSVSVNISLSSSTSPGSSWNGSCSMNPFLRVAVLNNFQALSLSMLISRHIWVPAKDQMPNELFMKLLKYLQKGDNLHGLLEDTHID